MKPERIVFVEDDGWRRLWPLTATRPTCDLRFGAWRLFEKAQRFFAAGPCAAWAPTDGPRWAVTHAFSVRQQVGEKRDGVPTVWWLGSARPAGKPPALSNQRALLFASTSGRPAGLWDPQGTLAAADAAALLLGAKAGGEKLAEVPLDVRFLDHLWDLLDGLEEEIARDLRDQPTHAATPQLAAGVWTLGTELRVAADVVVDPGSVLDTRQGPIFLDHGVRVEAQTHLVGPAYVGPETQLLGGRLSHTSFGPQCRVGGEVEATLFQGYANKRHQGFLGHAVVGEWVNLGAMTSNSDLKNNYGSVRVWEEGREVDTGSNKVGCFLGDHVKTGIGTLLTTGAVIGPGSNLFAGGRVTPRFLPAWSWWDGGAPALHEWGRFLATARTAAARRGVELSLEDEAALLEAHAQAPRP